jgi:hypothetical protein
LAIVRARRPVDLLGDLLAALRLVPVVRVVERERVVELLLRAVLLRAAGLRAAGLRAAGLRAVDVRAAGVEPPEVLVVVLVVVFVVSAIGGISPLGWLG